MAEYCWATTWRDQKDTIMAANLICTQMEKILSSVWI